MQMDKLGVLTSFIHNIIVYNIPLLYGTAGEIMVEKSGSLNLGVEGIMAVGAIFGYIAGCYANSLGVGIAVAFLMGALCGLLFATLTVSFQANQNITGLTLTTFGLGVYFFVGNGLKSKGWPVMSDYAGIKEGFADLPIPGLSQIPLIGQGLFSHNVLVYLGIAIAIGMWWYLNHTTPGLKLRAVGENPGAADSVGVLFVEPLPTADNKLVFIKSFKAPQRKTVTFFLPDQLGSTSVKRERPKLKSRLFSRTGCNVQPAVAHNKILSVLGQPVFKFAEKERLSSFERERVVLDVAAGDPVNAFRVTGKR